MDGYFAFYKKFDGKYCSRYKVNKAGDGDIKHSYSFNETKATDFFTVTNFEIKFKRPLAITNYSFALSQGHSIPTSWIFTGKNSPGKSKIVDKREKEVFTENEKIYKVDHPDAFKEYHINFLNNSLNAKYGVLRSLEFFGVQYSNSVIITCQGTKHKIFSGIFFLISIWFS